MANWTSARTTNSTGRTSKERSIMNNIELNDVYEASLFVTRKVGGYLLAFLAGAVTITVVAITHTTRVF